ncbi:MAG: M48 family metallopeptidase [Alphaproteobacteria bacterium]|nr:M48 family metallopeptidase [Alphaproteobacteria bacterium]
MKITLLTGKTFDIEKEVSFPIEVVLSKRAKLLGLRIDAKKRVPVLTVPKYCSKKQAVNFVKAQEKWIEEHLQKLPTRKPFEEGEKISFNGCELELRHCQNLRAGVQIENGYLLVSGEKTFFARRVRDFIKEQAQKILYQMSIEKAAKLQCKVKRVIIKDTKSRWGSCSSLNNINYNWRIMLAPPLVIDYLTAHEVAHLKHQDHSPEFWKCVDELAKDAAYGRQWLKKNAESLNRYI